MTVCIRCRRPLKAPTPTGMGRVCAKSAPPVLEHERDLFGLDILKAAQAAQQRVDLQAAMLTAEWHVGVRAQFRAARARLDAIQWVPVVWSVTVREPAAPEPSLLDRIGNVLAAWRDPFEVGL